MVVFDYLTVSESDGAVVCMLVIVLLRRYDERYDHCSGCFHP